MRASVGALLTQLLHQRAVKLLLRAYLVYLAICMLILLPLLNWGLGTVYQQQTGRVLHFNLINVNPFNLSITAHAIKDNNPDGSPFWSAQRVYINLSLLQSLIHLAPTVDELTIDGFWMHPHKLANGQWSFADIQNYRATLENSAPAPTPAADEAELPALIINNTRVTIDSLQFTDSSVSEPFHTSLDKIQFELHNFSTLIEEGQAYQLQATTVDGGELIWSGELSVRGGFSKGELALNKIPLKPVWQYFKSQLNFTLQDALLSLAGDYQVNWKKDLHWSLAQGQLSLSDSKLHSGKVGARNANISLGELALTGISATSETQTLDIADVQVKELQLSSWSEGEKIGLAHAFILKSLEGDSAPTPATESAPWVVRVKQFAIANAALDWRVAELEQHLFKVRQLNFSATNIDTSGANAMNIQLAADIDQGTKLAATGDFNPISLDGDFATELNALPVALAQPFLKPYVRADIASGLLNTKADLQVRAALLTQATTSGSLTDIKLRPTAANEDVMSWSSLKWSDARLDLAKQQVEIPLLELGGFDSRFVITKEGKTNLQALFPEAPIVTATPDAAQATPAANANKSAEAEAEWSFNLHKLVLDKAAFRFHDETLTPNFVAAVQNFSGELTGLSSDTSKPAQFKFHGDVDGYAPVNLQGKTQPFLTQPLLDARLDFENLDLGGFSGYSSTYAGWRIERGLLTANLHYRLNKGLILGDNHIEMDQLQLGERVLAAQAMDIPLRLALALITDENGLATLDIGVSGNPNDPSFDVGKVIRQAIRNTLVKIVQAPFKWIGNLVGSKEDLGYLPFNSGSSQLLTTATRKLNTLDQALRKRPELRIQLLGGYDQTTDLRGLRLAQVKQVLLEEYGLTTKDIKAQNERWQKAVAAQYRKLGLKSDSQPNPVQMHEQWLQTIVIAPEALVQLAAQRSFNAKQFLVQQRKVDSSRVLINSNLDCSQPDACTRRIVRLDLSGLNQTAAVPEAPATPATADPAPATP